jgi:NAD dependent epimerase/dehydratase family enzyme
MAPPSSILYLILGEMADIVVGGNYVSSKKIETLGIIYHFPNLKNINSKTF